MSISFNRILIFLKDHSWGDDLAMKDLAFKEGP